MDIAAFIISVLSFIGTFVVLIIESLHTKKINDINLSSRYFSSLFDDILLNQIPDKRRKISINYNKELVGIEDLQKVIVSLRKKCYFYYHTDKIFYDKINNLVQELEDYMLVKSQQKIEAPQDVEVLDSIDEKIGKIYKEMDEKYKNS